jgi:hypothetical protein
MQVKDKWKAQPAQIPSWPGFNGIRVQIKEASVNCVVVGEGRCHARFTLTRMRLDRTIPRREGRGVLISALCWREMPGQAGP